MSLHARFACGVLSLLICAAFGRAQGEPNADDVSYDFRGGQPLPAALKLVGDGAKNFVKVEAEGVRITLPATRKSTNEVGLLLTAPVRGNFEITTGYEILQADHPKSGHGVGFHLYVETSKNDGLGFLRLERIDRGNVYVRSHITASREGEKQYHMQFFETTAKAGQLRLTRDKDEVTLWAAEGAGKFLELESVLLGGEDLKSVRVSAYIGHAPHALDVRIKDLRVRGGGNLAAANPSPLAKAPPQTAPGGGEAAPPLAPRSRLWWAIAILVAATIVGLLIFAVRAGLNRRNRPAAAATRPAAPPEVASSISFPCAECGKKLKAKADLAGKRIKCPGCGKSVAVTIS